MSQNVHDPKCKDIPQIFWYPEKSIEREVFVYRLTINAERVIDEDFLSKYELDKKYGKDTSRLANNDKYYGVSTFEEIDDARGIINKVPAKGERFHGVSCGYTTHGRVRLPSPTATKSHITWWLYNEATPEKEFNIVEGALNE